MKTAKQIAAPRSERGQRHERAVEGEDAQHVRVPRRRHHMQGILKQVLAEGLHVQVSRPGMVETLA
jgi:hypothetical protein